SFARAVGSVSGTADVQARSISPRGVDEALYPRLARIPGVATVSPVVELSGRLPPREAGMGGQRITVLGIDSLRAMAATPSLLGMPVGNSGRDLALTDGIYLSRAAMVAAGASPGKTVRIVAAGVARDLRVAGVLAGAGEEAMLGVLDIGEAQWRFGQLGRLQRFDIKLDEGADRDTVLARLEATLPAEAEIVRAEDEASRSASLSRAYRVNLGMLAMVALLTGGFLVFSAQSLSVARRGPQFALLRVLGMRPASLRALVLLEGAALGLVGATLGVAAGFGMAAGVLAILGGDLGGGYFRGGSVPLNFDPLAAAGFAALGLAVAVASSWWPAATAARA
ncbi:ABC transporter permease, partial [Polymorphobacter multimanifer]